MPERAPLGWSLAGLYLCACGCAGASPGEAGPGSPRAAPAARTRLLNARAPGGAPLSLAIEGGAIVEAVPTSDDEVIDLGGAFLAPAFIDSHVHLAYWPVASELAAGGVAAAVDLAAPLGFDPTSARPISLRWAGPMITPTGGYPTRSWGRDGYGLECADAAAARAAVDALADKGVHVIKVPLGHDGLDDGALAAVVARAHAVGLRVAAHAVADEDVRRAGRAGVDVLAHTPLEPLSGEAVQAFADRAVISTLAAFGGSSDAVDNLRRLRAAGARVLYGTDLGNTREPAIQRRELELLREAGLDGAAILRAGTEAPADFWPFRELGALAPGRRASFLVLDEDPLERPEALAAPREVWIDGARR